MPDIVITPNRGTSSNPKIDFTGTSAGTIKLEVLSDGAIAWNGANGSLFSIADSLSGSLMSVNDISGLPAFEVFSDNRVIVGQFGANLLLGKTTSSSNGRLQLTSHTTNTGGIGFGSDVTLFRSAADILRTEDSFYANGEIYAVATGGGLKFSASSTTGLIVALQGGGIQFRNSSNANLLTLADAGNVIINSGTLVAGNVGTAIGAAPIVINGTVGDNDSHLIIKKPSQSSLSFLAWDGAAYIGTNTYYENATWIHNAPAGNTNSNLFVLNPGVGVMWYASSNSSASWNAAGGITLWNNSGVWQQPLSNTLTLNTNSGAGLSGSATYNNSGAVTFTVTSNATSANTASTIVLRDGSGFINATAIQTSSGGANGARVHSNSGITASNNYMNFFTSQTNGWAFNTNGTGADANTVVVIDAGGDLGIGTTNPTYKFEISGAASASGVARIGSIDYTTTTVLSVAPGVVNFDAPGIVGGRLKIDSTGKVGINITAPGATLDVKVQASTNVIRATDSNDKYRWRIDQNFEMILSNSTPTDICKIGQTDAWFNQGNVGIGTTTPSEKLHVNGGNLYLSNNPTTNDWGTVLENTNTGGWGVSQFFKLYGYGSSPAGAFAPLQIRASYPGFGQVDFLVKNQAQSTAITALTILGTGNVGIGLSSNIRGVVHVNGSNYSESPTVNKLITVSDSANSQKYMILSYHSTPDCGVIQGLHEGTAWKPVSINPIGANVGIGTTTPSYKLDVNGDARVTGTLIVQDGTASTNVFGLTTFTKSLTVTTSWSDVGISGADLATGSYIIQVTVDNYDVSGGQYSEYYTGFMSWTAGGTNSTDVDEIVLHKAGHAPNGNWINLRTVRQLGSGAGVLKLQIIASGNTSAADNYIFKFRRMI